MAGTIIPTAQLIENLAKKFDEYQLAPSDEAKVEILAEYIALKAKVMDEPNSRDTPELENVYNRLVNSKDFKKVVPGWRKSTRTKTDYVTIEEAFDAAIKAIDGNKDVSDNTANVKTWYRVLERGSGDTAEKLLQKMTNVLSENVHTKQWFNTGAFTVFAARPASASSGSRKRAAVEEEEDIAVPRIPVGRVSAPEGVAEAPLLKNLKSSFLRDKTFPELDPVAQALYELVWKLSSADRVVFLRAYDAHLNSNIPTSKLTQDTLETLGQFLLELFTKMSATSGGTIPFRFQLEGRYMDPTVLPPIGQVIMFALIEKYFGTRIPPSGGLFSPMLLYDPQKAKLESLLALFKDKTRGVSTPPAEGPLAMGAPAPVIEIDPGDLGLSDNLSLFGDGGKIKVPVNDIVLRIYRGILQQYLSEWLANRKEMANSLRSLKVANAENDRISKMNAAAGSYTQKVTNLKAHLDAERNSKRSKITQDDIDFIMAQVEVVDKTLLGMYPSKNDMIDYMIHQFTGPRPRKEFANHILITGEPGTGKTTLGIILRDLMRASGLIETPTLTAYHTVAEMLEGSVSEETHKEVMKMQLPQTISPTLVKMLGRDTEFILRMAVYVRSSDTNKVYTPGDFESTYTGGQVRQFTLALLRTLGSSLLIDEAYGLARKDLIPVADKLLSSVTAIGLQWSSMLLGYDDAIKYALFPVNEGFQRRYQAKILIGYYNSAELTAALIKTILDGDSTIVGEGIGDAYSTRRADDPKAEIFKKFDALYEHLAPYAWRIAETAASDTAAESTSGTEVKSTLEKKPRDDNKNLFRGSNVGAVQELFSILVASQKKPTDAVLYVTPKILEDVLKEREGRPFGEWPPGPDRWKNRAN